MRQISFIRLLPGLIGTTTLKIQNKHFTNVIFLWTFMIITFVCLKKLQDSKLL